MDRNVSGDVYLVDCNKFIFNRYKQGEPGEFLMKELNYGLKFIAFIEG